MMTMTLRVALVLVCVATMFLMMKKIRQSKLQIESAIFWIVLAGVLVVISIFPSVADFASHLVGIYATTNFLFVFAIFVLIMKVFYMTIHISQLETKIKELVQKMALEERIREERQIQRVHADSCGKSQAEENAHVSAAVRDSQSVGQTGKL